MLSCYPPKLPKWALNLETAAAKLWGINAGGVTCGEAIRICNHIVRSQKLPKSLRQAAFRRRNDLVIGRGRGRPKKQPLEVIQLAAHRK